MKLLFDQNLSHRLVTELAELFPDSDHVRAVGLDMATDRAIWEYAEDQGFVLVSKDSDFRQLAFLLGPPPKAIWLRVGNRPTTAIAGLLISAAIDIDRFAASEEEALLVLPDLGD